ncbi:sugar phosphate permease [Methylovirgula ligni]|uniref:Sugar phosphate permease n=1 Tax=Methylovirgula ligni TaxID=569860 RepID=A0A3D9Z3U6_9HYPH|nr:sugar phosphate permease [Methylovirgula ligni]
MSDSLHASFVYAPATRRLRTIAVILLVAAGCVNYLDRAAVAVAEPQIHQELKLSYDQLGLLLSAFAWSYGLAQIPAGTLIDRFGPRRVLSAGLILWSVAQMAATSVRSLGQFIVARIALGLGESPMYIGGSRVCTDWYALDERALPIAIFNSSSGLAPALAPPLLTWLMLSFGWRTMFFIAGAAGFVIAILWTRFYRAPHSAGLPASDLAEIRRKDSANVEHVGFQQALWLLRFPTTWGMFFGFFGVVYISWLYATWLPAYLENARHQSIASAGFWAAIPLGAGFLGALGGGFIARGLDKRGMDAVTSCRMPTIVGLLAAGAFTLAGSVSGNVYVAICLMAFGLFAANVSSSCGWALAAVIAPPNTVATLEAIQNVGGSLGGALAPLATGVLVQASGSFMPAFGLAGGISVVCALIYHFATHQRISASVSPALN